MNLRTTQTNIGCKRKKNINRHSRTSKNFSIISLLKIVIPVFIIFLLAVTMNVFNSETEQLNRRTVTLQTEINKLDRDIANFNIKCEKLKGRFIYKQVAYFNLKLHSPEPGQVRKLKIRRARKASPGTQKTPHLLISQR
jgi:Tfp pilus assembly protein PilN